MKRERELTKFFYSIREVSEIAQVKPHVLRYWESEFRLLRPKKGKGGRRRYTPEDIKLIFLIKKLLYEERYTLEGAKKRLLQLKGSKGRAKRPAVDKGLLEEMQKELTAILEILK